MDSFDKIYADYTFAPLVRGGVALARFLVGANDNDATPRAPKVGTAA